MLSITLATSNEGKAREFGRLLGAEFAVRTLPAHVAMPAETGVTFAANALLKANGVFAALGGTEAVLADDSGLEAMSLGGRPGVHSARYAGPHACDADNIHFLLAELGGVKERGARFVCALALVLPGDAPTVGPRLVTASGELRGSISASPRGTQGFGYDPVFVPEGWARTLAEASGSEKDAVSHRAAAVAALLCKIKGNEGRRHGKAGAHG
jgi:XTP/dITP diphosphohydrolase